MAAAHVCPSGTCQGNLAYGTSGGYRKKSWESIFPGSLTVCSLYHFVSKTMGAFLFRPIFQKTCFVIKSGCQFVL